MNVKKVAEATKALIEQRSGIWPPDGPLSRGHTLHMIEQISGWSGGTPKENEKAHRWLGWAQAAVCSAGVAKLDEMKLINLHDGDVPAAPAKDGRRGGPAGENLTTVTVSLTTGECLALDAMSRTVYLFLEDDEKADPYFKIKQSALSKIKKAIEEATHGTK